MGHQGDGWAMDRGTRVHVPFTVPGDVVEAEVIGGRGIVRRLIDPGPERAAPACRHFGRCGGCTLQHAAREAQLAWKRGFVQRALAQRGLEAEVGDPIAVPPGTRRRVKFQAVRQSGVWRLGFAERASHRLVQIEECPVLSPRLREFVRDPGDPAPHLGRADIHVLDTETGLAVDVEPTMKPAAQALWTQAAAWARARGVVRLACAGEEIVHIAEPVVHLSGVAVVPPPGAFLQATLEGEAALTRLVRHAVGDVRRIADLFAGIGTFTFALAGEACIHAMDGNGAACKALREAAHRASGLKPVAVERRDLFRTPLTVKELNGFDAVVFDPPRAGAQAQAVRLAASAVPRVVAVSCNPASFARDARVLVDGGYRLHDVAVVDQFVWSAHVELVARFDRE